MDSFTVGQRLEFRRTQLGLTLDDIANEIGVARSTIQRYEKDSIGKMKLPVIEAIARVLDVDPAWLCGKSDGMFVSKTERPAPANEDGLSPLDKQLTDLLRFLSDDQKRLLLAQIETLLRSQQ